MRYAILKRYKNGPKDLVRLEKENLNYFIKDLLIHNDLYMEYKKEQDYFLYKCDGISSYTRILYLNEHDKLFEMEDDESAKLFFEVADEL